MRYFILSKIYFPFKAGEGDSDFLLPIFGQDPIIPTGLKFIFQSRPL
jgi:hypothetical protein